MNEFWFKPHANGIGAKPKTWEGWALIAAYVMAMVGLGVWLHDEGPWTFVSAVAPLTAVLVLIAWRKTEGGWRWRWGKRTR